MSNKLQPCWHCGNEVHIKDIIDEKGLLMHEFVCATGSSCLGSGLFTAFFPEKKETAIEQWNRRAPLYSPVKPEDVTPGHYWLVTPDGEKTMEQIWDGHGNCGLCIEDPLDGWITVEEIYKWGGMLYSIPPLEVAE